MTNNPSSSNKYNSSLKEVKKDIENKGGSQVYKEIRSIEKDYRTLYIKAFGSSSNLPVNDEYKDKNFRLIYNETDLVHDVGKLISGKFRNYSCATMFEFTFENSDGKTTIDTEYEQPTILIIE